MLLKNPEVETEERVEHPSRPDTGRKNTIDNFDYRTKVHDETLTHHNKVIFPFQ